MASDGELAFLIFVIAAFASFGMSLAFVTWWSRRG
jgi:hypothetical protein